MNTPVRRLTLFALVLTAAPAAAQPGADDAPPPPDVIVLEPAAPPPPAYPPPLPPQPAPQNEPWNAVSHINGRVVPVGERGNYLYKWKKTNVASNPIGWMIGFYGLSISHAIHNNVAIRGDVNLFDLRDSNTKGYEVGASLPIYFKRVYQGPFIEPGLIVRELGNQGFCDFDCTNTKSVGPSVVFGWHWTFDSGLNIAAAFGLMRNVNAKMDEFSSSNNDTEPSGYFRIGYAF
ncbi:MAG: hypothetical protein H0V17_33440 [Deltaproteobacteria bacterium]|nr:hypothetical protein [Deltaproteobacteria bacterium]